MEEEKRKDAVRLRPYRPEDCRALAALFYQTVHAVADSDYTAAQRAAWAPEEMDLARWDSTLRAHIALVAVTPERYAGFGDIDETGYLDRLYVHADFQRRGIATALCDALETARDFPAVSRACFRHGPALFCAAPAIGWCAPNTSCATACRFFAMK